MDLFGLCSEYSEINHTYSSVRHLKYLLCNVNWRGSIHGVSSGCFICFAFLLCALEHVLHRSFEICEVSHFFIYFIYFEDVFLTIYSSHAFKC